MGLCDAWGGFAGAGGSGGRRGRSSTPPESPDAYYQEIGRAGRDGEPAEAVLFYRSQDLGLRRFFAAGKPDEDALARLAALLHGHGGPVNARSAREALGVGSSKLTGLVNLLQQAGAVQVTGRGELRYATKGPAPERAAAEAMELAEIRRRRLAYRHDARLRGDDRLPPAVSPGVLR